MFNMGFSELIFLAVIALIFIGPKQLPQVARTLAKLINEFKRASKDITTPMNQVKDEAQDYIRKTQASIDDTVQTALAPTLEEKTTEKIKEKKDSTNDG